ALGARAREIGDVAAVQEVENAVGENQGPRELAEPAPEVLGRADLFLEDGRRGFHARPSSPAWSSRAQNAAGTARRSSCNTRTLSPPCVRHRWCAQYRPRRRLPARS